MKIRTCAALLIAVLMLSLFAGCAAEVVEESLDVVEDAAEHRIDAVEDAAESAILQVITPEPVPLEAAPPVTEAAPEPVPPQTAPPAATEAPAKALSRENASAIALEHAGFTAEQVKFLHTEYEIDDRIPHYDVQFHEGYWEYEYEIHAETGKILSFEKDD